MRTTVENDGEGVERDAVKVDAAESATVDTKAGDKAPLPLPKPRKKRAAKAEEKPEEPRAPPPAPPTKVEIELSLMFIKDSFSRYYSSLFREEFTPPPRFTRREFGFIHFMSDFFDRHRRFQSTSDFLDYVQAKVPMHGYFSSAYYAKPDARTMKEKEWLGADLIFDLDADHIEGAKEMTLEQMLEQVKREVLKLIEEFLIKDFGFDPEKMSISFSGGRGYHIHIRDERYIALGSAERREIVAYITGKEVDPENYIYDTKFLKNAEAGIYSIVQKSARIPNIHKPGWKGRFTRSLFKEITRFQQMDKKEGMKFLLDKPGIGPIKAERIFEELHDPGFFDKIQRKVIPNKAIRTDLLDYSIDIWPVGLKAFFNKFGEETVKFAEGETDEPVTADIKRLIRLPGTLHGKTGLLVKTIPYKELASFDPLRDALVLDKVLDGEVKVRALKPAKFTLGGKSYDLSKQEYLPTHAAVFAIARRNAVISRS